MSQSKAIFITGAASGIGRATAVLFAQNGWFVGCFDRNAEGLAALETELGTNGLFETLDVTDREAVSGSLERFRGASGGRLDLLFNNAGIDAKGPFADMPWDRIMSVVNVNFIAGLSLIHSAFPLLRATEGSMCLSTASASAIFGTANLAVYSATKHAIRGLTEALSVEFAEHGVRAADILPGIIDTGMLDPATKAMLPTDGPLRALDPREVAQTAWRAYHGNSLHWYVPEELAALDVDATMNPEATRDRRIAGGIL